MLGKTLEQLDGHDWGEPTFPSRLVVECHRLRRVPLNEFTVEDLRLMIGQKLSLEHLVPLALNELERDPMVSGDYYDGDLLENVQRLPSEFWEQSPELSARWQKIQIAVSRIPLGKN